MHREHSKSRHIVSWLFPAYVPKLGAATDATSKNTPLSFQHRAPVVASTNVRPIPLEINILAFYGEALQQIRTKDVCKNKSEIARNEKYWATKKPDSDNIIKIILDGLNKVAFYDDAQVCKLYFEKRYAEIPRVKITIKNLKEKDQ